MYRTRLTRPAEEDLTLACDYITIKEDEQVVSVLRILYARRDWVRLLGVEQER